MSKLESGSGWNRWGSKKYFFCWIHRFSGCSTQGLCP
ncbi:unnamed protein product [Brassica rapa subsp. trilocularis]